MGSPSDFSMRKKVFFNSDILAEKLANIDFITPPFNQDLKHVLVIGLVFDGCKFIFNRQLFLDVVKMGTFTQLSSWSF